MDSDKEGLKAPTRITGPWWKSERELKPISASLSNSRILLSGIEISKSLEDSGDKRHDLKPATSKSAEDENRPGEGSTPPMSHKSYREYKHWQSYLRGSLAESPPLGSSRREGGGTPSRDPTESALKRKFDYDEMYKEHMKIELLQDPDISEHGSLIKYVLCELLTNRSETLMQVSLPSFMLECRSLLEVFSDFIRPGLLVEIPLAQNPEERMLRTLKFYLAGLSKMRGLVGAAKKPLNSVKGECFRCNWRPSANRQEGNVALPDYAGGPAEDYWVRGEMEELERERTKEELCDREKVRKKERAFSPGSKKYNATGLMSTQDAKDVRFIAEQISRRPPISAFYAECSYSKVYLAGTIETQAKLVYGCCCNLIDKVKIFSKGVITVTLDEFGEEYLMTLPNNRAKNVLNEPQVDFAGFSRIVCKQTGYHCVIRFPNPKLVDRFRVQAFVYSVKKGTNAIFKVTGKWNGEMMVEREEGEAAVFYNPKSQNIEKKITYPVHQQSFYESRRLWRDVVKNIIAQNWELAEEIKRDIETQFDEKPQPIQFFEKKEIHHHGGNRKGRVDYHLAMSNKPRVKKHEHVNKKAVSVNQSTIYRHQTH